MEEESQINFRALRAKFQEEALLAQTKTTRPTVAEKPKNLPPAGGHCSSVVSSINIATENKTTVVPRVIFRNELRASGGKRSTSSPAQPPQLSPSSQPINGDGTTKKQSFKERHMPQVLPVLCSKEHRFDPLIKKESPQEQELVKEVPQIKPKKNNLLLALKSSRVSKFSSESEEEPTYAELTTRPASAPGELPSVEKQTSEDGVSLQGDQLPATRHLSSPDVSVTPPLLEMSVDSDNRIISTLERAKRKFSCRHTLISSKSKSLRSPDFASSERPFLSSPRNMENTEPDLPPLPPPPVGLPHLACISARPFSKVNNSARKPAFIKPYRPDKAERPSVTTDLPSHSTPQKNPLPDLRLLGPKPAKPRRPPLVSLRHDQKTVHEVLKDLSQEPSKGSESEKPTSSAVLDAPVFPDFENPETEPTQIAAVDIAALDLKVLDLGGLGSPPPAPADRGVPESKTSQSDTRTSEVASESSVAQQLKVGSLSGIPSHPASFPEPSNLTDSITRDRRSPSEDVIVPPPPTPRADEAELAAAESRCARDETELRLQTAPTNEDTRTRASDQNYECDNVYEDVENINKFFLCQNSRKQKGNLKNPYADNNLPAKEEVSLHIWPRNPWGSISGEHSSHNLVHGKERQTPNTTADYKELKKREKQRLEKEKKEQKEREKKENEMKKKFKVTGDEEPMYHAKVMVASKVRKNDLPVKSGDTVSIIRTTNCPKGKWLARDASHKYGYISVMNVELNIKEMLELGKKAQAAGRGANPDGDTISIGSRSSSHLVVTSSFTDDSEEWACEDETLSACYASHIPHQTTSLAEASDDLASNQHTLSHANVEDLHTQNDEYLSTRKRHEALQKLAIFFEQSKDEFGDVTDSGAPTPTNPDPPSFLCAVEEPPYPEQEVDFSDLGLLPPPPLYADTD